MKNEDEFSPRQQCFPFGILIRLLLIVVLVLAIFGFQRPNKLVSSDVISTTKQSTSNQQDDDKVRNALKRFESTWPDLKSRLCPNMVPNVDLANGTLFNLAADELNFSKRGDRFTADFFTFAPEAVMYTSTAYKIMYLPIWKVANNQIRGGLGIKFESEKPVNLTLFDWRDTRALPPEENKIPNGTCIVAAVRDPVSHFLSGYNEGEFRLQGETDTNRAPYNRFALGSEERFEQFVEDFVGGISGGNKPIPLRSLPAPDPWSHVASMTGVLSKLDLYGGQMTDYLPSIHNLSQAFPLMLYETCPGLPSVMAEPFRLVGQHETSSDPNGTYGAAKQVWKKGGRIARALCALHALDYACWEKLPDGIPTVCKELYGSERFISSIIG